MAGRCSVAVLSQSFVTLVLGVGFAAFQYVRFESSLVRSDVLSTAVEPLGEDTNILLMGMNNRLDQKGKPLAKEGYEALHSGRPDSGGYNANVLMPIHVPASGAKATIISIPRDNYVALAGPPSGARKNKIKQAYGVGFAQEQRKFANGQSRGASDGYQRSNDAGRRTQIETVAEFLYVRIDHFVEVTMVAILRLAEGVAPITVCLNQDTEDSYAGARSLAGKQQLDGKQALVFVRQRRDTANRDLDFTDLDRVRRQEAFIASLAHQLQQASTLANPMKLQGILYLNESNVAVDFGLSLIKFSRKATAVRGGNTEFLTLQIAGFETPLTGKSINLADHQKIRRIMGDFTDPGAVDESSPSPTTTLIRATTESQPPSHETPADTDRHASAATSGDPRFMMIGRSPWTAARCHA